jgi:large subunit ribosomal protein L6
VESLDLKTDTQHLNIKILIYENMQKKVEIPEGVEVTYDSGEFVVKGPKGELRRRMSSPNVKAKIKDGEIIFTSVDERRKHKALAGTYASHMRNMILGVTKGFRAKLKAVHSHFPMKISVEGDQLIIQNFLGERKPRTTKILGDVKVIVNKNEITVEGIDKEHVGQTCANLERITKIQKLDKRVFQDGIYILEKPKPIEEGESQ